MQQPARAPRRARRVLRQGLSAALAGGCVIALPARPARAQLAVNRIELVLGGERGAHRDGVFTVTNHGSGPAQATFTIDDWNRDEAGSNQFYALGSQPGSCGHALRVLPATARLEAGAAQDVRVTLDSTTALQHECWGVVFVETRLAASATASHAANYVVRTGVKVYGVPPNSTLGGEITDMHIHPHVAAVPSPDSARSDVVLAFHSTGSRHTVVHGSIELRRPDNSLAGKVAVPDLYTLPGSLRRIAVALPNLPPGRYVALAVLDYGGDDLAAAQLQYEAR